ncbi:MAG: riboflavin biosynthesis protein [Vicingaceae bacterium]|nr:MAG: riboflavin biosynthesis protein [Vicingaceae bacterium]
MKIIRNTDDIRIPYPTAITMGMFDGVHRGHQYVIKTLIQRSKEMNLASAIVTFDPHPKLVLKNLHDEIKLLTTPEEKIDIISSFNPDYMIIIPFTLDFSRLTSDEFVEKFLIEKFNMKHLLVGYDHRFGRNRQGTFSDLMNLSKQLNFSVEQLKPVDFNGIKISSTKIRTLLAEGKVEEMPGYLGRYYSLSGKVIYGKGIGKQLGFPTANIDWGYPYKLLPKFGVYLVKVTLSGNDYFGICNVGIKPTLPSNQPTVEVYIFDFQENIYEKNIKIEFLTFIREEKNFGNLNELKKQIEKDVVAAQNSIHTLFHH